MCRIFLSDLDRALQVLRQSDRARPSDSLKNIQGKQRLLQPGADNHDVPGGVIESVHGSGVRLKKRLLGQSGSREVLARFADVMQRSTKLCEPRVEVLPHRARKGLGAIYAMSTMRRSLHWGREVRERGTPPSIYRFGFYLNLRLEVGGTYPA